MADLHPLTELTPSEVAHFITEGWVLVHGLIPAEAVAELVPRIVERVVDDGSEWGGVLLKDSPRGGAAERIYSPRYARVLADLCGPGAFIGMDGMGYMPIRFPRPAATPWAPVELHVDGNHFHHHVDSPEQALIAVELWSDIAPGGGGTAIIPRSHLRVSRILANHEPQGLDCVQLAQLAREHCQDIAAIEACGQAGDVLFMHPHLLHGSSTNTSTRTRIAGNRAIGLDRPLPWRQADAAGWTPVGLAIHQALAKG